jgi:hypothetical protein
MFKVVGPLVSLDMKSPAMKSLYALHTALLDGTIKGYRERRGRHKRTPKPTPPASSPE